MHFAGIGLILFAAIGATRAADASPARCADPPRIVLGVDEAGRSTPLWIDAVRDRISPEEVASLARSLHPLGPEEKRWVEVIRDESGRWCAGLAHLNAPFRAVAPPARLQILLGNQDGDDAFTTGSDTLVFDLGTFARIYGDARSSQNRALARRLLSHEYTHLLIHPYLDHSRWSEDAVAGDGLLSALRILYNEGIANLRSIDDPKWISATGRLTPYAAKTLRALEPVLIDRLERLRDAPSKEAAASLMRNISQGPLEQKWGAVTIALWLASDGALDPKRLAFWVEKKPGRILELGLRQSDPRRHAAIRRLLAVIRARERQARGGERP